MKIGATNFNGFSRNIGMSAGLTANTAEARAIQMRLANADKTMLRYMMPAMRQCAVVMERHIERRAHPAFQPHIHSRVEQSGQQALAIAAVVEGDLAAKPHMFFMNYGAKPHIIRARYRKALHFMWARRPSRSFVGPVQTSEVFFKKVRVRRIRARRFFERGHAAAMPRCARLIYLAFHRAVKNTAGPLNG